MRGFLFVVWYDERTFAFGVMNTHWLIIVFAFCVGLACGSFVNALEYRLQNALSVIWGKGRTPARSICPHCRTQLATRDLIPVVSYLWLGGRCRFCQTSIHWQYPVVELVCGILFGLVAWRFGATVDTLIVAFFCAALLFIFLYDLKYQLILDVVLLPLIPCVFVLSLVRGYAWHDLLIGALVGGGFFAAQYLLSRGRWIGGGDIRLGVLMGMMLGLTVTIAALFLAYIVGAAVALFAIARRRLALQSRIAFGTFLSFATVLCLLWGRELVEWYLHRVL